MRIALLLTFLFIFGQPRAHADIDIGGSNGGGGNAVGDLTVHTYLERHQDKDAKLARKKTAASLKKLRKMLPTFTAELERGLTDLKWYVVDHPLKELPFSRTEIPFGTDQVAVQLPNRKVYIYSVNAKPAKNGKPATTAKGMAHLLPREQEKMLVHELVRRLQLQRESTNFKLTPSSAIDASELIMQALDHGMPAKQLKEGLEDLGFATDSASPNLIRTHVDEDDALTPVFHNPMEVKIDLARPVTIQEARDSIPICLGKTKTSELTTKHIFGSFVIPYVDWDKVPKKPTQFSGPYSYEYVGTNLSYKQATIPSLTPSTFGASIESKTEAGAPWYLAWFKIDWDHQKNPAFHIGIKREYNGTIIEGDAIPAAAFPKMQYEAAAGERFYNFLGNADTNQHLNKISFIVEKNQYVDGEKLALRNPHTGAEIEIKLDTKTYVNCVKEEIEKASKKPDPTANPVDFGPNVSTSTKPKDLPSSSSASEAAQPTSDTAQ